MSLNVGMSFLPQKTKLAYKKGDLDTVTIRNVFNFTPTLDFRYKFNKTSQLRVNYRGRSSQPGMTDLLPDPDSSSVNIRQGNPGTETGIYQLVSYLSIPSTPKLNAAW